MLLNLPRIFEYTTLIAITYNASNFPLLVPVVCHNICERIYSKIVVGESHYFVGKKYCRRCECYFITKKVFCQCCGMQLRGSPTERELKEKIRAKKKPITAVL